MLFTSWGAGQETSEHSTLLPTVPVFADLVYGVVSDRRQDLGWAVGIRHEVACPVHGGETKGD